MEFIRRKTDYAMRSLIYMARFPIGKKLSIKIIAKKQRLPVTFLRKIFQKLSQRKIVNSSPGPAGGFYLLKKPQQITLKEILEVVQGPISLSDCLSNSNICKHSRTCKMKFGLSNIQYKLISLLDKYTLKDFIADAQ